MSRKRIRRGVRILMQRKKTEAAWHFLALGDVTQRLDATPTSSPSREHRVLHHFAVDHHRRIVDHDGIASPYEGELYQGQ